MHALVRNKLHAVKGPQVHCVRVSAYFLTMLFSDVVLTVSLLYWLSSVVLRTIYELQ
jgi:hypothetical protein